MEGVACRIALVYQLLRPALPAEPEIIASGGAIQGSPAWQQILADALNRPVRLSRVPETSTRGAVLLALEALGAIKDAADAAGSLRVGGRARSSAPRALSGADGTAAGNVREADRSSLS